MNIKRPRAGDGPVSLKPLGLVLLSATLFGVSTPLAKLLLGDIRPVALAGLLYLGVFLGLTAFGWGTRAGRREARIERQDLPWLAGAVLAGGVVGPVCLMAVLDGAAAGGMVLFIRALKGLGAFRTGILFSVGPFVGSLASLLILGERVGLSAVAAGLLMLAGVALVATEKHGHAHRHERTVHAHSHRHGDRHHPHAHDGPVEEPHSHEHVHEETEHDHGHWPDTHHRHGH